MNYVRQAIAVLLVALMIAACRDSSQTGAMRTIPPDPTDQNLPAGDAPTSPVPPGNSSRIVRPPDPGAVRAAPAMVDPPANSWRVYFYPIGDPTDPPLAVSVVPDLYLDMPWQAALPDAQLADQIESTLWARNVEFEGGAVRVYVWGDGAVQLWVNNHPVIDEVEARQERAVIGDVWLDRAGLAQIRIAYRPTTPDARLKVWWEQVTTFGGWRGEYFANRYLTGQPLIVRNDLQPVFDWGTGSPAPHLPADDFAVRWSRTVAFEAGTYRFTAEADDGVRVYLEGMLLINAWDQDQQGPQSRDAELAAGEHSIVIEYYEAGDEARVSVDWEQLVSDTAQGNEPERLVGAASSAPATAQEEAAGRWPWSHLQEFLSRVRHRLLGANCVRARAIRLS